MISAAILTRNEEENIRYCLETVKWCDEIVLVDMESTDSTATIAREFTDKIFAHPKVIAFDIAKRYAVDKTAGDWILIIDADEMVQRPLAERLRQIAEKNETDIVEIPFKHYILGDWIRYTGWGYTPLPRFFRKGQIEFTKTIHDYMQKKLGARVLRLDPEDQNCIIHFNYRDSEHFIEKLNRYTNAEADILFERSVKFSLCRLLNNSIREFLRRFFTEKGYKDGIRGFALAWMMCFYRAVVHIKLWERQQHLQKPVSILYNEIKMRILSSWRKDNEHL